MGLGDDFRDWCLDHGEFVLDDDDRLICQRGTDRAVLEAEDDFVDDARRARLTLNGQLVHRTAETLEEKDNSLVAVSDRHVAGIEVTDDGFEKTVDETAAGPDVNPRYRRSTDLL